MHNFDWVAQRTRIQKIETYTARALRARAVYVLYTCRYVLRYVLVQLKCENGILQSVEQSAEIFNQHFASVFSDEVPLQSPMTPLDAILHEFQSITITETGVAHAIERLPCKTCPGPDGISAKLLKLTSDK